MGKRVGCASIYSVFIFYLQEKMYYNNKDALKKKVWIELGKIDSIAHQSFFQRS